jgi:glycogen debranching enzyme
VNAFGHLFDLYTCTGPKLLIAAWDYHEISGDKEWVMARLPVLHRIANFLVSRDIDGDGLVESLNSGNAGTLRDPGRADVWFEMMNFGHKNGYTNALAYRAFRCLADMMDAVGEEKGASYYRRQAGRLGQAYVAQLFNPETGWFAGWKSQDGQIHDYGFTFVNGLAVAYGIVPPGEGKEIMARLVKKSHEIGFQAWHLGVPANLLPASVQDMILPPIQTNGEPDMNLWGGRIWQLDDRAAFGHRYSNGTIHPSLVWHYLLGLQVAGLEEEAERILDAMTASAEDGLFQNGVVNVGYAGAEHFYFDGNTCGYEGYLPESFNFLMGVFTRDERLRSRLLRPLSALQE